MDFSDALKYLKAGARVARSGWNGKNMWLILIPGSMITVVAGRPLERGFEEGTIVEYLPHIDMKTADGKVVPWLASQTDILANDWEITITI